MVARLESDGLRIFCIDAFEEAIKHNGAPEIFNTG